MRKLLALIFVLGLVLGGTSVLAQDGRELSCDEGAVQDVLSSALAALETAQTLDTAAALETITAVRASLAEIEIACNGLTISGENDKVFGPVEIPAGYYRVTATSDGLFIFVEGTRLDGECGGGFGDSFMLFDYIGDERGPFEIETVLRSEGCTVLWEVSEAHNPYTITFERVQ